MGEWQTSPRGSSAPTPTRVSDDVPSGDATASLTSTPTTRSGCTQRRSSWAGRLREQRAMQDRELLDAAWAAYREDDDPDALDFLVRCYAPLAGYLAQRALAKAPEHQEPEEILGFAQDGLLDALGKFNPAVGVKFETYATRRIAGE